MVALQAEPTAAVFNHAPLAETPFANLPLGSVRVQGWLLGQLENQREGLTGQAEQVIPEIGPDSGWRGGPGESWEKGPYYLKGLVSLAYTLNDAGLKKKAQTWIDAILTSQQPDGFYGPGERNKVDWWPRMVVNWALRDYYEATADARVLRHLRSYYGYMLVNLPSRPLFDWGKARAADEMDNVFWLYNRTGDPKLLEIAVLLRKQAWDWVDIYAHNRFQHFGTFFTYHNVNVPQAFKFPLMTYELTKARADGEALIAGWQALERDHGLPFGMTSGTEFLSGTSPSQGTEMCSFVEQMLSFYTATRVLGTPDWAERAEKVAFNGMPAGLTKDFKQYQYYTLPNQVIAKRGPQHFNQEYDDGVCQGPHSGCHCCCYNLHMGWPKFAQHAWMATADHGLAVVLYAPTEVTTPVQGQAVRITETTDYPFNDTISLHLKMAESLTFPLHLRIPAWSASPVVKVNGETQSEVKPGTFHVLNRTWKQGDVVSLTFPMSIKTVPGVLNTVSVERGPLVYALKLGEKLTPVNQEPLGFHDLQCEATSAWNYALEINPAAPATSFRLEQSATLPRNPYLLPTVPLRLLAKARRLPAWKLAASGLIALDPPVSPVQSTEALEEVTLVPIGATLLHITSFPWLGAAEPMAQQFSADFTDGTLRDWVLYGGNCSVRDGHVTLGPDNDFLKAVVPSIQWKDLSVEADFTIGDNGDGGLMLRATQVATGPDAHQGYYVGLNAGLGKLVIGKQDGLHWKQLAMPTATIAPNQTVHLKVIAQGQHFRIYLGTPAQLVHEFDDADYPSGTIGFRESAAKAFTVDNVNARAF